MVDLFLELAQEEGFWATLESPTLRELLLQMEPQALEIWIDESRLDTVIDIFADAVDVKSPFTGTHSRGVATVAEALARQMRLSDQEITEIRRGALLHDLGKMMVPNSILDKPGKLDSSEWETIRLHPYQSQRILERIEPLRNLAVLAGAHHERLDGSGYFRNLKGDDIPLGARILAVADVFHALSEDRPYRERMETDEIISTMEKSLGTHLDPECFTVLKDMV